MAAGGKGFILFARSQTDTPGKLATHGLSYEALEIGSYELLSRVAERAGDAETAGTAKGILADEVAMRDRIAADWDAIVEASLEHAKGDDLERHLVHYLGDAHALENQAIQLLEKAPGMSEGAEGLAGIYQEHLEESRRHEQTIRECLERHEEGPSRIKDAAMRIGGLNWGMFFQAHPDTPGKLAAFAYAFEHLEIGGYEQLWRVATRAGDTETAQLAERISGEERAAAEKLRGLFPEASRLALREAGVTG